MTLNKPAACTAKFTREPAGIVWLCVHAEDCTQSFFHGQDRGWCLAFVQTCRHTRQRFATSPSWKQVSPEWTFGRIHLFHQPVTTATHWKNDKPCRKDQSRNSRTRWSRLRTTPLKAYLDEPSTVKAAKPSRKLHNIFYGQKRTDKSNVRLADWLARPPLSFSKTRRPTPVELSRSSGKDSWTNAELLFQLS